MILVSKKETFFYLILGMYIATPSKINIFYQLITKFTEHSSRSTLELMLFVKLAISIIGAIIVIAAIMELFNKIQRNEFA